MPLSLSPSSISILICTETAAYTVDGLGEEDRNQDIVDGGLKKKRATIKEKRKDGGERVSEERTHKQARFGKKKKKRKKRVRCLPGKGGEPRKSLILDSVSFGDWFVVVVVIID